MKTSEALLVLFFRLTSIIFQQFHNIDHVPLGGFMQRGVTANIFVLCYVYVSSVLNKDVDDCAILSLHSSEQRSLTIDILVIDINFIVS